MKTIRIAHVPEFGYCDKIECNLYGRHPCHWAVIENGEQAPGPDCPGPGEYFMVLAKNIPEDKF